MSALTLATGLLPPGLIEVTEPIKLSGTEGKLRGTKHNNVVATRIRRGRRSDGGLYDGPLILVEDCRGAEIKDLIVDGGRFAAVAGRIKDERHPLTTDRSSPKYPCGRDLPEPDCYQRSNFASDMAADILLMRSSEVLIEDVTLEDAVRIGIALAQRTSGVTVRRCTIRRAGDYGVWAGAGAEPAEPRLPLQVAYVELMPKQLVFRGLDVESCGAAGIYLEARDVTITGTRLVGNCCDAPYDDEGGQLTIEYKTTGVRVVDSAIIGSSPVVRSSQSDGRMILGSFGVEACGSDISFESTLIEGNSREGVQLLGARNVRFGHGTRIVNNHTIRRYVDDDGGDARRSGVTISTTSTFADLGAVSDNIALVETRCENGLTVWSDGSVADLKLGTLRIRDCDLTGSEFCGVFIGENAQGGSLRGGNWSIDDGP